MAWRDKKYDPRKAEEQDYSKWFSAAAAAKPPRGTDDIRREIYKRNPVRWKRLQRELKWARKQMKKLGYNPDEVRWIL